MANLEGKYNVLVFPAGEVNSVELHDALCCAYDIRLYGASSVDRHGEYIFENYYGGLPYINDSNFLLEFNKLLRKWDIDFIFPTHDSITEFLAVHQKELESKVICADVETAKICRDKKKTFELFKSETFCPIIYQKIETFPVFIKPRDTQGGQGAYLINSHKDIMPEIDYENYVICEYLPGEECTIDCLSDMNGNLMVVLPRTRERLFSGIAVKGRNLALTSEILSIAVKINEKMSMRGLWYFQIKRSEEGIYKLLEISTRCAGTMCMSRIMGANLPLMSVYLFAGKEVIPIINKYNVVMDRTLIARYKMNYRYDKVYMDYDDTLIIRGKVCRSIICFLYQCMESGITVYLLTRHEEDHEDSISESLKKYAISESLFEKITILTAADKKADFIDGDKAIFIDNSFNERRQVSEKLGIPVFDVDQIELLLDWRF